MDRLWSSTFFELGSSSAPTQSKSGSCPSADDELEEGEILVKDTVENEVAGDVNMESPELSPGVSQPSVASEKAYTQACPLADCEKVANEPLHGDGSSPKDDYVAATPAVQRGMGNCYGYKVDGSVIGNGLYSGSGPTTFRNLGKRDQVGHIAHLQLVQRRAHLLDPLFQILNQSIILLLCLMYQVLCIKLR
ncbi:hypothetical protein Hanom_Chr04g00340261 [Helianthus anomalus]